MWNGVISVKRKINYIKCTEGKEEFVHTFCKWLITGMIAMILDFTGFIWKSYLLCCLVTKLCLPVFNPVDCSLPGSCVHGIFQARIQDRLPKSRGSYWHRDRTMRPASVGRFFASEPPGKPTISSILEKWHFKVQKTDFKMSFLQNAGNFILWNCLNIRWKNLNVSLGICKRVNNISYMWTKTFDLLINLLLEIVSLSKDFGCIGSSKLCF